MRIGVNDDGSACIIASLILESNGIGGTSVSSLFTFLTGQFVLGVGISKCILITIRAGHRVIVNNVSAFFTSLRCYAVGGVHCINDRCIGIAVLGNRDVITGLDGHGTCVITIIVCNIEGRTALTRILACGYFLRRSVRGIYNVVDGRGITILISNSYASFALVIVNHSVLIVLQAVVRIRQGNCITCVIIVGDGDCLAIFRLFQFIGRIRIVKGFSGCFIVFTIR